MKAVILAAGLCTRLRHLTGGMPKTLLPFGERSILDYQLSSLNQAGIREIAVVVGYRKEDILRHVNQRYPQSRDAITFIENPIFEETNNIYSLWLARDWVGESGFLAMNADVLYHPDILLPALASPHPITVIMDTEFREESMKVQTRDHRVAAMRKGIPREESSGTYVGITRFLPGIGLAFFAAMKSLLDEGRRDVFFNVAVEKLIARGVPVGYTTTGGLPWAEIDDEGDLEFARTHILPLLLANLGPAPLAQPVGAGAGVATPESSAE